MLILALSTGTVAGVCTIEINNGVGTVLNNDTLTGTVRQITPNTINLTIKSTENISDYTLYIENTDPDLVKAYGNGITQTRYANNTMKLVFDLIANETKYVNLSRIWYPTNWSFVVVGDTRPAHDNNSNYVSDQFEEIVLQVQNINPVYPIPNSGDIVGGGSSITSTPACTEAMHAGYWSVQKNKGIWLGTVGNHDQARDGNPQGSAQVIFDKYWGKGNYSYSFGNWYFININSYADDGSAPNPSSTGGFISNSQYNWIDNEVKSHNTTYNEIVVFHHPLWRYRNGDSGTTGNWQDSGDCTNLRNLFTESGVKLSINGHEHHHHESVHGELVQLVEGRGGAPLDSDASSWGFSIVELNSTDIIKITKIDIADGVLLTNYNTSNNYTKTNLKATINNGYSQSIPCMLKFRMSDANATAYQVTGADYYDIIKNEYGYVVIAQATVDQTSTKEITVNARGGYTITLSHGYNMIGWTSTNSKTSSELCSIVPNCAYVYKKNPDGSWTTKHCGYPGGNFNVSRGFGFMAYITQECDWTRDE